jgi:hypothetical protein
MRTFLMLTLLVCLDATAQPSDVHLVPFASDDNRIELSVANTTGAALSAIEVIAVEIPAWLDLRLAEQVLESVGAGEEPTAVFHFDVSERAPVGQSALVRFEVRLGAHVLAEKHLHLEVESPREVVLRGNYPNPFSGQTQIGYALPSRSEVTLRVYDVLGREVATLVERAQEAGYHEAVWEASRYASGLYLYRMEVEEGERGAGERVAKQGTMLLVK